MVARFNDFTRRTWRTVITVCRKLAVIGVVTQARQCLVLTDRARSALVVPALDERLEPCRVKTFASWRACIAEG